MVKLWLSMKELTYMDLVELLLQLDQELLQLDQEILQLDQEILQLDQEILQLDQVLLQLSQELLLELEDLFKYQHHLKYQLQLHHKQLHRLLAVYLL